MSEFAHLDIEIIALTMVQIPKYKLLGNPLLQVITM
jgi:hypothetical protein